MYSKDPYFCRLFIYLLYFYIADFSGDKREISIKAKKAVDTSRRRASVIFLSRIFNLTLDKNTNLEVGQEIPCSPKMKNKYFGNLNINA